MSEEHNESRPEEAADVIRDRSDVLRILAQTAVGRIQERSTQGPITPKSVVVPQTTLPDSVKVAVEQANRGEFAENQFPELGWRGYSIHSEEEKDQFLQMIDEEGGSAEEFLQKYV